MLQTLNTTLFSTAPAVVKIAMEIAYLCCARQADVLEMKKSQLIPEGILIKQIKTAVSQIKGWSPRLEKIISMATDLPLKRV